MRVAPSVRRAIAVVISMSLAAVGLAAIPARAAAPTIGLRASRAEVVVKRQAGRAAWIDPGVFIFAKDGPLELRIERDTYDQPFELSQVVHRSGKDEIRPLDNALLDRSLFGLKDFFDVAVTNSAGEVIVKRSLNFCPNSYERQRLNDEGPATPTYPQWCFGGPFTKGMVWGLDEGWATAALSYWGLRLRRPDGRYTVAVSIAPAYVDLFGADPATSTAEVVVKLVTGRGGCHHSCERRVQTDAQMTPSGRVATMKKPHQAHLPDLIGLPAWGMDVTNRRKSERAHLRFGATVWVGGASPLHVEGFRRQGEDVMDAFQYFYEGDEIVGRAEVGTLEFDQRRGHTHWHFQQFAEYRLVNAEGDEVKSTKEAFCLAPTDPIDLTLPDAEWTPYQLGLGGSNCGYASSLWVKEVLPLGWGDTYIQSRPGQSFNITNLPNGTYYVEVEANPGGHLEEQDATNNVERRKVVIKGKPGARFVRVPPWNGIDTENYWEGGFMGRPAR